MGKLGFFVFWRGVKKGVYFIGVLEGLWPPIGLTKISKMGEGYGQMSINDFLAHFTLLGCKGG